MNEQSSRINVLDPYCPSRRTLALLADKWTLLVIVALKHGHTRNGEIKRALGDISQKMLTQTLRQLENSGLVQRTILQAVPPHVEYTLTPLGESLHEPIDALKVWAESYYAEVEAAQRQAGVL